MNSTRIKLLAIFTALAFIPALGCSGIDDNNPEQNQSEDTKDGKSGDTNPNKGKDDDTDPNKGKDDDTDPNKGKDDDTDPNKGKDDDTDPDDGTTPDPNKCDIFNAVKDIHAPNNKFHDTPVSKGPDAPTEVDGIKTMTFQAGQLLENPESMVYLDFDSTEASPWLKISDKEAFNTNKDWDLGLRQAIIATNGGDFNGKIQIANVAGDDAAFKSFDLKKAKALPATDFHADDPVDNLTKACKANTHSVYFGMFVWFKTGAAAAHPSQGLGMYYSYAGPPTHDLVWPADNFLVLKKEDDPNWFVKFRVTKLSNTGGADGFKMMMTLEYAKLQ